MSLRLRAHITSTVTKDGLVLLDERAGRYWQLNNTGAVVLRSLLKDDSPEHIGDILATKYQTDSAQCRQDVDAVIEQLIAADLLTQQ